MRYLALACDYDGTLARDGRVAPETIEALERLRSTGRHLILVTGRVFDDLASVFPRLDLFERIVAENGAVLFTPRTRELRLLADAPPPAFVDRLRAVAGLPVDVGKVIVATIRPWETEVLSAITELGLELQIIFNKDAVMVLPPGVNKASGLVAALADAKLSSHNVVAVGDAENDHALLQSAECGVAVANALPMLQERADLVTGAPDGIGVAELADRIRSTDLAEVEPVLLRHAILVGRLPDGQPVRLSAYGGGVLVTGQSGGGKSTLTTAFLERLGEHGYQYCLVDPEGDYEAFEPGVVLGTTAAAPDVGQILGVLETPERSAIVNLTGVSVDDRPRFLEQLLPRLQELRARTARPHWIIFDEAHHLLPASWHPARSVLPTKMSNLLMVSLEAGMVTPEALTGVETLILIGSEADAGLENFARASGETVPAERVGELARGEAVMWRRGLATLVRFELEQPKNRQRRHKRKYAEGELLEEERFVFRGPEGLLKLSAENLRIFLQMADGVDDATWVHHLRQGDYSRWFRAVIKDGDLAAEAEVVERADLPPAESRGRIREAVERRYTV